MAEIWVCEKCKTPVDLRQIGESDLSVHCPKNDGCSPHVNGELLNDFQVERIDLIAGIDAGNPLVMELLALEADESEGATSEQEDR